MPRDAHNRAIALTDQIRRLLQDAHFAARELEDITSQDPADRYPDRIHRVRKLVEMLRSELEALAQGQVDVPSMEEKDAMLQTTSLATPAS